MQAKNVVLVEDDPDDRELFIEFLNSRTDITLLPPMQDGVALKEYLERIMDEHDLPDLIVLDQNMPRMNGKQTLKFLKTSPRYSRIPAVIYSTYTNTDLIIECKALGAAMVAGKPIDFDGYQKMMDDFLEIAHVPGPTNSPAE